MALPDPPSNDHPYIGHDVLYVEDMRCLLDLFASLKTFENSKSAMMLYVEAIPVLDSGMLSECVEAGTGSYDDPPPDVLMGWVMRQESDWAWFPHHREGAGERAAP